MRRVPLLDLYTSITKQRRLLSPALNALRDCFGGVYLESENASSGGNEASAGPLFGRKCDADGFYKECDFQSVGTESQLDHPLPS